MLESTIKQFFAEHGPSRSYYLAYSGGLDSQVLLHLCAQQKINLRVLHINHQLSPYAAEWEAQCAETCARLKVPYRSFKIDGKAPAGASPEAYARAKRYEVLTQELKPDAILLTAHHQDDQAETLLVQLLRGAGPKGLAAMPKLKPLGAGWHARPLLAVPRAVLKAYAEAWQLSWIEDESNNDTQFTRNFIRHEVLPLLKSRWLNIEQTLARTAAHCAEAQELLLELASDDLVKISAGHKLSLPGLLALPPARQRLVLRTWLQSLGYPVPETVKLKAILDTILTAKPDRMPYVQWEAVELRRYGGYLHVLPRLTAHDHRQVYVWNFQAPLTIPNIGVLQAISTHGQGIHTKCGPVTIRFRQGGEHCLLRGQHRELKKLFQEWQVPPWLRSRTPLIYVQEELIAVLGHYIHEDYAATADQAGWVVILSQ